MIWWLCHIIYNVMLGVVIVLLLFCYLIFNKLKNEKQETRKKKLGHNLLINKKIANGKNPQLF